MVLLAYMPVFWAGYVFIRLQDSPYRGGKGNFGPPFASIVSYLSRLPLRPQAWDDKLYLGLFLTISALSLLLALRELLRGVNEVSLAFAVFAVLPVFLTERVWVEPWSYGRVTLPAAVFLLLNFIRSRDKIYLVPLSGHMVLTGIALRWLDLI